MRRVARFPLTALCAGLTTYGFNRFMLKPIYLNDLNDLGLADKYFSLDLNADLMKEDLEELGIKIKAKYFDLEKAEKAAK